MNRHETIQWADDRLRKIATLADEAAAVLAQLEDPTDYRRVSATELHARYLRDCAGFEFVLRVLRDGDSPDAERLHLADADAPVSLPAAVDHLVAASSGRMTKSAARDALRLAGLGEPAGQSVYSRRVPAAVLERALETLHDQAAAAALELGDA